MPEMGKAHRLLSARHPDTSRPAGGADPSDGQVVTWSDALDAFHAADPPAGVTDHGALTGLFPDDDHAQYALNLGRPGGQTIIGATGASEHLTLRATSHATRGYVRAQDDLQLLSNIIRDSGGTARLTLAVASPEVSVAGDLAVSGHSGLGGAGVNPGRILNVSKQVANTPSAQAASFTVYGLAATGAQATAGVAGAAWQQGTPTMALVYGLFYAAQHSTSSPTIRLTGVEAGLSSGVAGTGAITEAWGVKVPAASWVGSKPTTISGIRVEQQGHASVATAYGLHIAEQTATTVRLLELGPATPYLRVVGGANPAANQSHLYLKLGATLKQVTEYDADSAGVGYRALRVPN